MRLFEEGGGGGIARGVVSDDEAFRSALECYCGGVGGGAVVGLGAACAKLFGEGAFVEEEVYVADKRDERFEVCRVGAVGVAAWRLGWSGQFVIGDDGAVLFDPIFALLDAPQIADGYLVKVGHLAADMCFGGFLDEEEACAGDAVVERQGVDRDGAVVVDHDVFVRRDCFESYLIAQSDAKIFEEVVDGGLEVFVGVYREVVRASEHPHRAE